MKVTAVLVFLMFGALGGCTTTPEVRLSAEDRAACLEAAKPDSNVILIGIGYCTEYGELKRMRGIWLQGNEMSAFHEGEQNVPMKFDYVWDDDLETDSWLSVNPEWILKRLKLPPGREGCPKAIYLEFEGREGVREIGKQSSDPMRVIMIETLSRAELIGIIEPTHRGRVVFPCKAERFSS